MEACLLGGALGDSLGLPSEGLTAARIARIWTGRLSQRFFLGRGMVSDDTEHAVMTVLSMDEGCTDSDAFSRALGRRLRWWFIGLPAGIGLGTARSIIKLWFGVSPLRSGSTSAGNGPMMRAVVIGLRFDDDPETRRAMVDASTLVTHRDPRALEAGRIVAELAALAVMGAGTEEILLSVENLVESSELDQRFKKLREALREGDGVGEFADAIGSKKGFVSGFAPDTLVVVLYAWLRHRADFRKLIDSLVSAGGDTDTAAFIGGSLCGIECGVDRMPEDWVRDLKDWPIDVDYLKALSIGKSSDYPNFPLSLFRNALFLLLVLGHGFRRLLPPY